LGWAYPLEPSTISRQQTASSDRARFLIGAEHVPQSVTDFAQRRVSADGVENVRHCILGTLGRAPEAIERSGDRRLIPPPPQRRQFAYLAFVRCLIDLEDLDGFLVR